MTNDRQRIRAAAERSLGIDDLRAGQTDAIAAILEGHDVLAVMATGYGKSAIFPTAAAMLDGVTVVVSPLIALQQDQVESLRGLEGRSAPVGAALHSKLPEAERTEIRARIRTGEIDILYLSPEQLVRDDVRDEFDHLDIALVAVDEAHCVSSWGHEFRPDYLRVADAVEALGRPPIIALTATAAPRVRDDIVEKLKMRGPVRITGGFDRPEIRFEVDTHADESATVDAAVRDAACQDGQGLVYVDTTPATEKLARELSSAGTELPLGHAS